MGSETPAFFFSVPTSLAIFTKSNNKGSAWAEYARPAIGRSRVFIGLLSGGKNKPSFISFDKDSISALLVSLNFAQYLCPVPALIMALAAKAFGRFRDSRIFSSVSLMGAANWFILKNDASAFVASPLTH